MNRFQKIKLLDEKTRNQLRYILSNPTGNVIFDLKKLRSKLNKRQVKIVDDILSSPIPVKATRHQNPFPSRPAFVDFLMPQQFNDIGDILNRIEANIKANAKKLDQIICIFRSIDLAYSEKDIKKCRELVLLCIEQCGWSHAILRKLILIRESGLLNEDNEIESLIQKAGLSTNAIVVASLIHIFSKDQNYLTIKRSILNISDQGVVNRYSRLLTRLPVNPISTDTNDFVGLLTGAESCSLIDAIIVAKFNTHLFRIEEYPQILNISEQLGDIVVFEKLLKTYNENDSESEYLFFKQSSAWLEYKPVREYRLLVDKFYDSSIEVDYLIPHSLDPILKNWIGEIKLEKLVSGTRFTRHSYPSLAALESSGTTTRSAIFNYWLFSSKGELVFDRKALLALMGLTRDLSRTIPIHATRNAVKLSTDRLVKLILLLLLAKRSTNELDSFNLRRLLEDVATREHNGSLIKLIESYEKEHPDIADYIYDVATEDFLAKLNKLAPHRSDIPEIRASLHEWKARFSGNDYYLQRARAVRIDHQLNRLRDEIDDYRMYVDPSRFSSWVQDEKMIDLKSALTYSGSGKKSVAVSCDESLLAQVIKDSYNAFCANAAFGIESYIGRRIRHGTFHGNMFSSVIYHVESCSKFSQLFKSQEFLSVWEDWKASYDNRIKAIIIDKLHVQSKRKPQGLLQPEVYSVNKQEIVYAAVKTISKLYTDVKSVEGIEEFIIEYCWRLAECDLLDVTSYLESQRPLLKQFPIIDQLSERDKKIIPEFRRELFLTIDRKISSMLSWFKRPSNISPRTSVSLLFDAIVEEVRDSIPDFNPQGEDIEYGSIELVGWVYHIVYDSLAVVVSNAAKHGDPKMPVKRSFSIVEERENKLRKRLVVEVSSSIRPSDRSCEIAKIIEQRKCANFDDANLYQGRSGISKLMQLASNRQDFFVEQLEVLNNDVIARLSYVLEH